MSFEQLLVQALDYVKKGQLEAESHYWQELPPLHKMQLAVIFFKHNKLLLSIQLPISFFLYLINNF